MDADLKALLADASRRMKKFEESNLHRLDMFDRDVDRHHHTLSHKYRDVYDDLRPISAPLWGVIMETSGGQRIYAQNPPFELVGSNGPRRCQCHGITYENNHTHQYCSSSSSLSPSTSIIESHGPIISSSRLEGSDESSTLSSLLSPLAKHCLNRHRMRNRERYGDTQIPDPIITDVSLGTQISLDNSDINSLLSVESKTIMEGRRWGINKYLYDDDYVSNAPYGIVMKRQHFDDKTPTASSSSKSSGELLHTKYDYLCREPNTKLVSSYWRRKYKIPDDN